MSADRTRIFGIRHHGPGSARSLRRALESFDPEVVLIEGPPDADEMLVHVGAEGLVPPVALLVYESKEPRRAAFFPFARFSPEWVAIAWANARGREVRFCDLPIRHQLKLREEGEPGRPAPDPLAVLARAAGDADGERWWSRVVEEQRSEEGAFDAIAEAMIELRSHLPGATGAHANREALREAFMRKTLRSAERGGRRVAAVVGAWHLPALVERPPAAEDNQRLKGLPRTKVTATWVPWTHGRLALSSGYGAGVDAPGWYDHLFSHPPEAVTEAWLTRVARAARAAGHDAPPASVIDAVRLAESLSVLRGSPAPGLDILSESAIAALLDGRTGPMEALRSTLVVGELIGEVPPEIPEVPLAVDLRAEQKAARLPPEAAAKELVLDLREPMGRAKSRLLRRLALLDIPWGQGGERMGGRGAFKEGWRLQWSPELSVRVIDAARWGQTLQSAATACARSAFDEPRELAELSALLEETVLAELPDVTAKGMRAIEAAAAGLEELGQIADALPRLARIVRYGDARGLDATVLLEVANVLGIRLSAGLERAVAELSAEAERSWLLRIEATDGALRSLGHGPLTETWQSALRRIADHARAAPGCRGRAVRRLLDSRVVHRAEARAHLERAVALGSEPGMAARWLDGFLAGSALLLLHDPELLSVLDRWILGLSEAGFEGALPLLRRAFSDLPAPERARLAARLEGKDASLGAVPVDPEWEARGVDAAARWLGRSR